jgi:galactitol PTS system EIIC component
MLNSLGQGVHWVLNLGPSVMLPIILTIFGLLLRQRISKAFRAALTIGVGFVGINLVIGLLMGALGPAAQSLVKHLGIHLNVLDVGWPIAAAISFGTPIAPLVLVVVFVLNIILVAVNFTKTMDVDIWNYWHFIFSASIMYYATHNVWLALLIGCIVAVIIFKLADWTQPAVENHFGLPGVSLPHTETTNWAPLMYALDRIEDKIPGFRKLNADPDTLVRRFGLFGEPLMMGLILGILLGILGGFDVSQILTLGIQMAAVLVLLPRMVAILMEGLIPISEGARDFITKRFPGKSVYIGLDAAVVIGHPAGLAVSLIMVPITIFLAVILPYNHVLPFADLAVLPFTVIWAVAASRGNIIRGLVNSIITLAAVLYFATSFAPLTTTMGHAVQFQFPSGATQISSIDVGSHIIPWIVINLIHPISSGDLPIAIVVAVVYILALIWVRKDISRRYAQAQEITEDSNGMTL